jgi:hypothetical protein
LYFLFLILLMDEIILFIETINGWLDR